MCGIALIYHADGSKPSADSMDRMVQSLRHRGPDGSGSVVREHAALGHTRLSIVDVRGGAQPMSDTSGRWCIVYNGEIYNYQALRARLQQQGVRFATRADTEVLLHLYAQEGPACLSHLRGMFSFAIHDRETGEIFCARDRLGIKPFFYHWNGRQLLAASEMKAIFASGLCEARFHAPSLLNYFTYQFGISPYTVFSEVFELPPGSSLHVVPRGEPRIQAYWDIEFPQDGDYETLAEPYWSGQFADTLADAVACHTIGEVPIGSYLSGGIDSAAVAWLLSKAYAKPLQTFSIHFLNPRQDESEIYRRIAAHLQVPNVELTMDDHRPQGYLDDFRRCLYHLEQPQRMAVDIPHFLLSQLVQTKQYKVVYTGDGADEIFGGYDCYRQDYMRFWGNQLPQESDREAYYLREFSGYFSQDYLRMLAWLHHPQRQLPTVQAFGCYPAWFDFWQITADLLPGLFHADFAAAARNDHMQSMAHAMLPHVQGRHMLNQSLYIETKTRLPGWILWKSDRLSMAHGVEGRVPFMDHRLVELAARVPPEFKLNGMNEKYLLKQIAVPHLPQVGTDYKKRAFYTPIREWFFEPRHRQELQRYFDPQRLRATGVFDADRVRHLYEQLLAMPAAGDVNSYYRVMQLEWILMLVLSVQILHELFIDKKSPSFGGGF